MGTRTLTDLPLEVFRNILEELCWAVVEREETRWKGVGDILRLRHVSKQFDQEILRAMASKHQKGPEPATVSYFSNGMAGMIVRPRSKAACKHENLVYYVDMEMDPLNEKWIKKSQSMRSYEMFLARYCWYRRPATPSYQGKETGSVAGASWTLDGVGNEKRLGKENLPALVNRLLDTVYAVDSEATRGRSDERGGGGFIDERVTDLGRAIAETGARVEHDGYLERRYQDTLTLCELWREEHAAEKHVSWGLRALVGEYGTRDNASDTRTEQQRERTRELEGIRNLIDVLTASLALVRPVAVRSILSLPGIIGATGIAYSLASPIQGALKGGDLDLLRMVMESPVSPLALPGSREWGSYFISQYAAAAIANGKPDAAMAMLTHPYMLEEAGRRGGGWAERRIHRKVGAAAREGGYWDIVSFCESVSGSGMVIW